MREADTLLPVSVWQRAAKATVDCCKGKSVLRRGLLTVFAMMLVVPTAWGQQLLTQSNQAANRAATAAPGAADVGTPTFETTTNQAAENGGQSGAGESLQIPTALNVDEMLSPDGITSTLKLMVLLTVLSLAPSILIMTTCFVRFVIVFGLLRQALGTQQLPPNQVVIALCLFLTLMVMMPVWQQSYDDGIRPYTSPQAGEIPPDFQTAFQRTVKPIRHFMREQIERTGNADGVWMFLEFQQSTAGSQANRPAVEDYEDVSLGVLLPAFLLSEIKTAFLIGFQLYLPFVIIDMVVSSVLISMGMMMLPPVLISLPFKLMLFVLIDGWTLTVSMLLDGIQPFVT